MTSSRESAQQAEPTEHHRPLEQPSLSGSSVPVATPISLCAARERRDYRVAKLELVGDDEARIKNMGICVGRRIEMLQPGDPLIVKVSGASVGVSRRLAVGILLEPLSAETLESSSCSEASPASHAAHWKAPLSASIA